MMGERETRSLPNAIRCRCRCRCQIFNLAAIRKALHTRTYSGSGLGNVCATRRIQAV